MPSFAQVVSVFAVTVLGAAGLGAGAAAGGQPAPAWLRSQSVAAPQYIIVILTDDQRFDEVDFMPHVVAQLKKRGLVFTRARVSNPLCCPVRASILSGGYDSRWTHVYTNVPPDGGVWAFDDRHTLATRLQRAGYRTALVGKYLNGYRAFSSEPGHRNYVPPGWSTFYAYAGGDWQRFYVVTGSSDAAGPTRGTRNEVLEYIGRHMGRVAVTTLESALAAEAPLFLLYAPAAPHLPAAPDLAAGDAEIYTEFGPGGSFAYRGRGWGEQPDGDVSDKPAYIQYAAGQWWSGDPSFYKSDPFRPGNATPDDYFAHRLQSLQSVDRTVGRMVELLRKYGVLDRTVIVYTSDHGYLMGEHTYFGKRVPYEEALRVPLIVRVPGVRHRRIDALVVMDLDLPATILDLAGDPDYASATGRSLRPWFDHRQVPDWRQVVFVQSYISDRAPAWVGAVAGRYKWVQYSTLEQELYDLLQDPYELRSLAGVPGYADTRKAMQRLLDETFRPLRFVFPEDAFGPWSADTAIQLPPAKLGQPYAVTLRAEGGKPPYRWRLTLGGPPAGLRFDPATGQISGTPRGMPGTSTFRVRVEDHSVSPYDGRPQGLSQTFRLDVNR